MEAESPGQQTLKAKSSNKPKRKRIRPSRSKGLRTKTGCSACRKRHLKCGEQRPSCSACEKASLECEYSYNLIADLQPSQPTTSSASNETAELLDGPDIHASSVATVTDDTIGLVGGDADEPSGDSSIPVVIKHQPDPSIHDGESHTYAAIEDDFHFTETSPDSTWSGWPGVTAEAASLRWYVTCSRTVYNDNVD
jgi:hypothetical protein